MAVIEVQVTPMALDVYEVTVRGDKLDLSTAAQFKERMLAAIHERRRIVLNLSEVSFVDSSGFGAILSCLRDLNMRGGDLKLCCVQKRVRTLLELVRMHRIVGIHDTSEQAVAAFATTAVVAPVFTTSALV